MISVRKAEERGHADHGWLDTYHTFSFASYHDPQYVGFRSLRVMNEDRVAAGQGFGMHAHHDMEIVTYVLAGALEHKDSMGNGGVLRPGEFQRMTAGTGLLHSEFNPSPDEPAHFYQIWLLPEAKGLEASYEQRAFDASRRRNRWQLVGSRNAASGSLTVHQDVRVYLADIDSGTTLEHTLENARHAWLQVLRGEVRLGDVELASSDGAAVSDESLLRLEGVSDAEVMLFDLA